MDPAPGPASSSKDAVTTDGEPKVGPKGEIKEEVKVEIKDEPYIKEEPQDDWPLVISATNRPPKPSPTKPKKEEEEEGPKLDNVLPVPGDMFEDVDGEDDVEYVDNTFEGIAHVNGVRHFVCEGFKIRQVPEPLVVKRSLHDLNACILAKSIVLDPDYEREVVWDEGRAAMLITSILMGYFIPPIIFNVRKNTREFGVPANVKIVRICVDGKQRLTSIWKFMTGRIGFFDTSTPQRKWYFCHRKDPHTGHSIIDNRNILPKAVRDFFQKQYFCCYEYDELDADTEETMFQLVQRGIALTSAEKMRALSTPWATFARQFEDDYDLVVNVCRQSRGSGFRLILTIFAMLQEVLLGGFAFQRKNRLPRPATSNSTPVLQASPKALERLLVDKTPIPESLKTTLKSIFDKYETLVKLSSLKVTTTRWKIRINSTFDPSPSWLFVEGINHTRSFSPIEFVGTAVLIATLMDYRSDTELLADVRGFRKYLRICHKDLRVNSGCWAFCWKYISGQMDLYKGIQEGTASEPPEDFLGDEKEVNKKLSVEAFLFARANKHNKEREDRRKRGERESQSEGDSELSHLPSDLDYDSEEEEGVVRRRGRKPGPKPKEKGNRKEKVLPKKTTWKTNGKPKRNRKVVEEDKDATESDPDLRPSKKARKAGATAAKKRGKPRPRKSVSVSLEESSDQDPGTEFPNLGMNLGRKSKSVGVGNEAWGEPANELRDQEGVKNGEVSGGANGVEKQKENEKANLSVVIEQRDRAKTINNDRTNIPQSPTRPTSPEATSKITNGETANSSSRNASLPAAESQPHATSSTSEPTKDTAGTKAVLV